MKKNIFVGLITLCAVILVGCTETEFIYNGPMPDGGKPDDKPVVIDYWELDATTANNLTVVEEKGEYSFVTTGGDPFISSIPFVFGTEVVTPFRYTVCLVNSVERNLERAEKLEIVLLSGNSS